MDVRAAAAVRFGSAEDLAGDRGDLALAEDQEAEKFATGLPSVHSKYMCGPPPVRSRMCRAARRARSGPRSSQTVSTRWSPCDLAVHVQLGLEVGGVGDGDLDEDHVVLRGEVVVA